MGNVAQKQESWSGRSFSSSVVGQNQLKAIIHSGFRETTKTDLCSHSFAPTQHCKFIEITMAGAPTIDLVPYKAQIIAWFQDENKAIEEIAQLLSDLYDKCVAPRTLTEVRAKSK